MQTAHLIPAEYFCMQHNIDLSFIRMLNEMGLIEIATVEESSFIPEDRLPELERMIRLHYELDISFEGIEAILHLLRRVEDLHQEILALKSRLRMYESSESTSY